jgi:hypothetical protein
MKNLFKILVFSLIILPFTSCVDEDDFDFDSLSQTTINPAINAPLINTEIKLSDFLNLEEVSDTTNGFELRQVNEDNDSYLEFIFSVKDSFNINDFTKEITELDDAVFELEEVYIPNLNDFGIEIGDIPEINFSIPDSSMESEDISVQVDEIENGARIDSIKINSGSILIQHLEGAPLDTYIELTSNTIKNNETGEFFNERLQISSTTSSISQTFDLSNYTISLKDTLVNGENKNFIDLRYRLIFNLASNESFNGGIYDIKLNLSFSPITIDAIFGDFGETEFNITDTLALDFFKDSIFNSIVDRNGIDFEKVIFDLSTSTNIGVGMNIIPNIHTITSEGNIYNVFNINPTIYINRAPSLGEIGYTNHIILESDASAIEIFPDVLVYDIDFNFKDSLEADNTYPKFISPNDAFVTLDAKASLPLKAKLKDLHYETTFDAFDFIEEMNYLKSTTLLFYLESTFPAELSVNLFLMDSNSIVFDTLLNEPFTIPGANIDSQGRVLSPTGYNIELTLDNSKYESLKNAKKIKLTALLNTSKDSQGEQRYVRFSNDATIKIKASVKAIGNVTF